VRPGRCRGGVAAGIERHDDWCLGYEGLGRAYVHPLALLPKRTEELHGPAVSAGEPARCIGVKFRGFPRAKSKIPSRMRSGPAPGPWHTPAPGVAFVDRTRCTSVQRILAACGLGSAMQSVRRRRRGVTPPRPEMMPTGPAGHLRTVSVRTRPGLHADGFPLLPQRPTRLAIQPCQHQDGKDEPKERGGQHQRDRNLRLHMENCSRHRDT
jgi:hypothetical protein